MKQIISDAGLVAFCGLYCGACGSYLKDRCPGCHANKKAKWCTVRACCMERGYLSCAQCDLFGDPRGCAKFNNVISRLFGFFFRSDRAACIAQIRALGIDGHAIAMAKQGKQTIRR